ncbi:MAG: hypothetical protein GY793_02410 [Proteobacteria bacterium]|nr:hypothetical protein [Pseudomonadota bacterium]
MFNKRDFAVIMIMVLISSLSYAAFNYKSNLGADWILLGIDSAVMLLFGSLVLWVSPEKRGKRFEIFASVSLATATISCMVIAAMYWWFKSNLTLGVHFVIACIIAVTSMKMIYKKPVTEKGIKPVTLPDTNEE